MKSIQGLKNGKGWMIKLEPLMMAELSNSDATFRKPVLSLNFKPYSPFTDSVEQREDLCFVFGYFYLMYCHEVVQARTRHMFRICAGDASIRKFMKSQHINYRVDGWDDFVEKSKHNELFSFLLRCSTISKELFDLAKENYAVRLPFTIDAVKYVKEVGQPTSLSSLPNMKIFIDKRAGTRKERFKK